MKHKIGDVVEFKTRTGNNTIVGIIRENTGNTYTIGLNYITVHNIKEEQIIKNRGQFKKDI